MGEADADGKAASFAEFTADQLGLCEAGDCASVDSAFDRVVIVHNNAGQKVGCGLLGSNNGVLSTSEYYPSNNGERHVAEGYFKMKICNDEDGPFAQYQASINFRSLNFLNAFSATEFNYHLHSKYDPTSTNLGSTSGHYDPTYKCGGASSFQNSELCSTENYKTKCGKERKNGMYGTKKDDHAKCELGDTSSKMGKLKKQSGRLKIEGTDRGSHWEPKWTAKDMNPPRNDEFSWLGGATGTTYSSVVVHACTETECSARVFGARLVRTPPLPDCISCDDISTRWMTKNGKSCEDSKRQIHTKCLDDSVWTSNGYCRTSCSKAGRGYPGEACCQPSVPPTDAPTACTQCTNTPTAWMIRNDKTCEMLKGLMQTKCRGNAGWTTKKYCQKSCFEAERGYHDIICC